MMGGIIRWDTIQRRMFHGAEAETVASEGVGGHGAEERCKERTYPRHNEAVDEGGNEFSSLHGEDPHPPFRRGLEVHPRKVPRAEVYIELVLEGSCDHPKDGKEDHHRPDNEDDVSQDIRDSLPHHLRSLKGDLTGLPRQ